MLDFLHFNEINRRRWLLPWQSVVLSHQNCFSLHSSRFYRDDLGNPPPPPPPHHHHHHQSTPQPGNFILNQRTQNQQYPPPNHYNYPNTVYPNQGCAYPNQEGYP
ncbi:hypothetical protein NC653_001956 [Populus alba x Populus x berolinensis]|uniref:Uncharacterized protein n=1 Tax=Populus alba x Populus x berolinensis TaxID=444605 RepID=A0AAD6RMV6_9ROSI|nr:hypothetical protein NC653_001956 [Populus alba x Populus x berolinensis]